MLRSRDRSSNMLLLLPCLLLSLIERANSMSCFQCNSYTDPDCFDVQSTDTHSPYYMPCEENSLERSVFCRKVNLKVKMDYMAGGAHERVIRSCAWERSDKAKDCYRREDPDHEEVVCQCFRDGCNSGTNLTALSLVTLISFVLLRLK